MKRAFYLGYGVVCYVVFFATFLYAIGFVENELVPRTVDAGGARADTPAALVVDGLLLGLFAIQHSVMARRGFKQLWTKVVPEPIERSTYVLCASSCLIVMFRFWRPIPQVVWSAPRFATLLTGVSLLGWGIVLVGTFLINHFDLFGLRQVYMAARGRERPPHRFRTPVLYRIVRHPIYLGFIIAFWSAATMTVGHLVFAIATLGYILVAIQLEERDLVREYGDTYVAYRQQVRGLVPVPRRGVSKTSLIVGASVLVWLGRPQVANAGVPAWCNGASFDSEEDVDFQELAAQGHPERVMIALAEASCSTGDVAREHKAEIDRARAAWGKKYGMADADWAEVIAYDQDSNPNYFHADFSTQDITKFTPVDQFRLIWKGWNDDFSKDDPLYYADALDGSLSEAGRAAFLWWCTEAGTQPQNDVTRWAVCEGDFDKFDRTKLFAELHRDPHDGTAKFFIRMIGVGLADRIKDVKEAKAALIKKDAAYGKLFDAAAKGRAEWVSTVGSNTKLLDLVLQMDAGVGFHSRKLLDGCEAKTAEALTTAVSTIPAKAFAGVHDVPHGSSFAQQAVDVLARNPAVSLAAIAAYHCAPESPRGFLAGGVIADTPSARGPRDWALTAIMGTDVKLDDLTITKLDYPDLRNHPFPEFKQADSFGGVVRSVKVVKDEAMVSLEKTTQQQQECVKEHRGRLSRIRDDGSLDYEIICDKWTTVTRDATGSDVKVRAASAKWLKPGVVFSAAGGIGGAIEVIATWPTKTAKLPNMVLGAEVK